MSSDLSSGSDRRSTSLQRAISRGTSVLVIVVGAAVLAGWQLDVAILRTFLPSAVAMKANTAAAFLLAGLALTLLQRPTSIAKVLVRLCAVVITLIGLLTLCQYLLGWNLGIDQMLFHEPGILIATSSPGRMAPNTALNFVLLGFAFFLLTFQRFRSSFLIEFPLVFSLSISILGFVGYVTGFVELTGPAAYTQMAANTAGTFTILCFGMLFTAYERQRALVTIEQKLFAGLTFTAAVIVFISFLSVSGITSLVQASSWVEHTQQAKNQIDGVLAQILEVQSAERGFLLSGDDNYLAARKEASHELPTVMDSLRFQMADNPRQQELFASLEKLVEERIAFSDRMVSTRRTNGEAVARLLFATGRGKAITDSIRVLLAQMLAEEDRLLQTRNEDEKHQANRTQLIIYLSLAVQVLLLAFIFVVVKRDVTGRKQGEEVLRQKTEELDQYFTHTLDLLCIADSNGYFRRLNKAWESTLGYSLQDLEGKPFLDFVHPEDLNATLGAMADLSKGIEVLSFTNRYRHKDGTFRFIEWRSFPAGNLIYASARDITESKQAQDRLRLVIESAPNAIILVDSKGIIHLVNVQAENYFGYHRDELLGKKIEMLVPKENALDHPTLRASFFSHPDVRSMGKGRDLFGLRKDGSRIPIEVGLSPIHFEEEMLVLASIIDITERKKTEENIQQSNAKLETANKELEAFSYSVSHDLRAPLRHINGFIELLQKRAGKSLDETSTRFLKTITRAAARMGMLIDDLLSFSRMGRQEMQKTTVDMNAMIAEILTELNGQTKDRNVLWNTGQFPPVKGDRSMLRLAMVNLLQNAVKFTTKKEKAVIDVGCEIKEKEIVVFVKDNGAGFDMQYANKLFGVFERLHNADEFEGTGIGLANVRRIIHRHGGRTWAEGKVSEGATFYFTIPLNTEERSQS